MSLFDRYRRASLAARSLLSAGAAALGTLVFLGATAGAITMATAPAGAASDEETLASETGTSDPGGEVGDPPARSGAGRTPARGAKASTTKVAQRRPASTDSDREDDE